MDNESKRKFIKKAAVGAPIILVSTMKPAWGMECLSGMMSGNLSNHQHQCDAVSGLASTFWRENFVGSKDEHYKRDDPSSNVLKRKFKHYDGCYFVKIGRRYHFSDMRTDSYFGDTTCQFALESHDAFMREIVTARINASIPGLNYVYSITDVEDIYRMVLSGADEHSILDILTQVHQS